LVRPVIHSTKHYVQITLSTAATVTRNVEVLATAVEGTAANLALEVVEGTLIKAIYLEIWAIGGSSDEFFTAVVLKLPGGLGAPSFTNMTDLNSYPNKKNILYTTQGLASNDGIAMPLPLFKGWIKIPRGKQRMGLGDTISFIIASRGADKITYCGFATYKEYS